MHLIPTLYAPTSIGANNDVEKLAMQDATADSMLPEASALSVFQICDSNGGTRYVIDVLAQWGEEDGELWVASPFIDENITAINAFSSCAQERGKHVKIHIVTRRQSFSWIEICMLPIGFWFWIFQDCPGCSYSAPPALFCAALLHICQAGIKHCVGNQARQFHPLPIQQQKKQRNKAARTTHKEEHMLQQDNHNRSP